MANPSPKMKPDEAQSLARLISSVDSEGKRAMEWYLRGAASTTDYMWHFRSQVDRLLNGNRLKPTQRMQLLEWASIYGRTAAGDEPRMLRLGMRVSLSEAELFERAAHAAGLDLSKWLRRAAFELAERQNVK